MRHDVVALITKYSPVRDHEETPDMVRRLATTGRFMLEGEERTPAVSFEQSVEDYVAALSSTASLSRATLGPQADDFYRELRTLFARQHVDRIRNGLVGYIAWGRLA